MTRHHLDGDAIAADAHYGQDRPEDCDFCDQCGRHFDVEDPPGDLVIQHPVMFMLCEGCASLWEDAE